MISKTRAILNFLVSILAVLSSIFLGKIIVIYRYGLINVFANITYTEKQEFLIMIITMMFMGLLLLLLNIDLIINSYREFNLKKYAPFIIRALVIYAVMFYVYALLGLFQEVHTMSNAFGQKLKFTSYPVVVNIIFIIMLPVINEILFRMSVMRFFKVSKSIANFFLVVVLSVMLVLIHHYTLINNFVLTIFIYSFVMNFLLYRLYYRCTNVLLNILVAMVFNIILIINYLI